MSDEALLARLQELKAKDLVDLGNKPLATQDQDPGADLDEDVNPCQELEDDLDGNELEDNETDQDDTAWAEVLATL
jgi:hypothetical protein